MLKDPTSLKMDGVTAGIVDNKGNHRSIPADQVLTSEDGTIRYCQPTIHPDMPATEEQIQKIKNGMKCLFIPPLG